MQHSTSTAAHYYLGNIFAFSISTLNGVSDCFWTGWLRVQWQKWKSRASTFFFKDTQNRNKLVDIQTGAPNDNFRKTIWDLEFSEHLWLNFLLSCLSYDFRTCQKWYNCPFLTDFYLEFFRSLFSGWNFRKGKFLSL